MRFAHVCGAARHLLRCIMEPYLGSIRDERVARHGRGKVTTMLVAILNFLRAWRRYNASLKELSQLGDRELADIGITRSDIPRIAWESADRGN
jgi:uncharacterized protein YjiS (DUF1127 family)